MVKYGNKNGNSYKINTNSYKENYLKNRLHGKW